MDPSDGPTTGFDYLRIGLAVGILFHHSLIITTASLASDRALWSGSLRFLPGALVPMFFALSGFLVAGSLARNPLHRFLTLRLVRIFPALIVEVVLSALLLGPAFTVLPVPAYLSDRRFQHYFLNIIGDVHTRLPGVFPHNPLPEVINTQLWTIPFEFKCYLVLATLALIGIVWRAKLLASLVILATIGLTLLALLIHPVNRFTHPPGTALVLSFMFGAVLFVFRRAVPHSPALASIAMIAGVIALDVPNLNFAAALPIAYLTIWLGLLRPPPIRFGDLSYGVYLFHFPIMQLMMHFFPSIEFGLILSAISLPVVFGFAFLSWTCVESPFLRRKRLFLEMADAVLAGLQRPFRPIRARI